MHERKRVREPAPLRVAQAWQHGSEVRVVLLTRVLRLEEDRHLRASVRNPVGREPDQLLVRHADALIAARDPRATLRGLPEEIDAPHACRPLERPGLVRFCKRLAADLRERDGAVLDERVELEPGTSERLHELPKPCARHRKLEILVLAVAAAEPEIDRPPGRDVPRRLDPGEGAQRVSRMPRRPGKRVRVDVHFADAR
jgi:hypothetical protein